MFFLKVKTSVLLSNRFGKQAIKAFQNTSFSKATVVMQFPANKNAGCPNALRDFPPRKDGILHPRGVVLGLPSPFQESVRAYGRTLASQPKFLGLIGYQICLPTEFPWRASL